MSTLSICFHLLLISIQLPIRLDKLEGPLVKSIKFADWTNKRLNSLTSGFSGNEEEDDDDDNDKDSQSYLNNRTIQDFFRVAQT